jgi:hypothetical protein
VKNWLRQQSKDFYAAGFEELRRNKYYFQLWTQYVSVLYPIYDLFTDSTSYFINKICILLAGS